jgi:hypothetical protein
MNLQELKQQYPNLPEPMLRYFVDYILQGAKVAEFDYQTLEKSLDKINPNVIFNLPAILQTDSLKTKMFAVRELVFLTALATAYIMQTEYLKKSKKNINDNVITKILNKAAKAIEPEIEPVIATR